MHVHVHNNLDHLLTQLEQIIKHDLLQALQNWLCLDLRSINTKTEHINCGQTFWQLSVFDFENVDIFSPCAANVACLLVRKPVHGENRIFGTRKEHRHCELADSHSESVLRCSQQGTQAAASVAVRTSEVEIQKSDNCIALGRVSVFVFSDRDSIDRLDQLGAAFVFKSEFLECLLQCESFSISFAVPNEFI